MFKWFIKRNTKIQKIQVQIELILPLNKYNYHIMESSFDGRGIKISSIISAIVCTEDNYFREIFYALIDGVDESQNYSDKIWDALTKRTTNV